MMMASFSLLSSSIGFFGRPKMITKPSKNVHLQKRCSLKVNSKISNENRDMSTMTKMEVGVNKLVHAVKGLMGPKQQNLVLISKNGSAIKEFELELEDPEEKLGVKIVEGMQFDSNLLYPYFLKEMPFDNENCKLLLVDKIKNAKDLDRVLKDAIKGGFPILIITSWDDQREALDAFLASSWPLGAPKIAVFTSHGFLFDYLNDIALLTGATVIRKTDGLTLENVDSEVLGFAAKVVVSKGGTTIVGDGSRKESLNREAEKIRELVLTMTKGTPLGIDLWDKSIREIYEEAELTSQIERLDKRLVRLYERVAVVEVGRENEKEVEEKKQRFDVVLHKIKTAFKKGIVAGGGCTLDNDEHKEAADFVKTALSYPIKQIAKNAGVDENVVVEKVLSSDDPYYGYKVLTQTSKDLEFEVEYRMSKELRDLANELNGDWTMVERLLDFLEELHGAC